MKYRGSCHCGQIAFELEGEIPTVLSCNCSICQHKGALMWFVPRPVLHLLTPPENMRSYRFNRHVIQHYFCPNCGIHPFGEGVAPTGETMAAINVRCLEDLDIATLDIQHFNGRAM